MKITANQQQHIEFKNYTCKIDVLGQEKEITYNNVIWVSTNKRWIFYINDCEHFQIEKINDWVGDLPLLYEDGSVGYNNPENLPRYIKDRVQKTLIKLAKYE